MTLSQKFLDYEVALLLAKYGKNSLLGALAKQLKLTPAQLEAFLQSPPARKSDAQPKKRPSLSDLVTPLAQQHPNKAEALRKLCARLDKRTFPPALKDVDRLLGRHGPPAESTKCQK